MDLDGLDSPERVENIRRSIAMANPDRPVLTNAEVDRLLRSLAQVLVEMRRLRRWCGLE